MGSLAIASGVDAAAYGRLGVRYQTLRGFYRCVRDQHNAGKSTDLCGLPPEEEPVNP
jgi:hypothetical protein